MGKKEKAVIKTANSPLHGKDNAFFSQYKRVRISFKECPKTMLRVSRETGIERASVCRYVSSMLAKGEIALAYKGKDACSGCIAGYYTTNKALFPHVSPVQLELGLFDDEACQSFSHTEDRHTTEDFTTEERVVILHGQGKSIRSISSILGLSKSNVGRIIKKLQ